MPKRRRTDRPPPPPAADEVPLRTFDEDAAERASAYRRRHKTSDEMCGAGNRDGSWRSLQQLNTLLTPCGACATLCSWPRVLRAADIADDAKIAPRDGCAAPGCSRSRWHKAARHAATQQRWATQLLAGTRVLFERPTLAAQPNARRLAGTELDAAIDAALALVA